MTKCRTKLVKHFITFLIVNANQNVMAMKVKSRKLTKTVNFTQILHHKKKRKKKKNVAESKGQKNDEKQY